MIESKNFNKVDKRGYCELCTLKLVFDGAVFIITVVSHEPRRHEIFRYETNDEKAALSKYRNMYLWNVGYEPGI